MKRPLFFCSTIFMLCTALSVTVSGPLGAGIGLTAVFVLLLCGEPRRTAAFAAAAAVLLSQLVVAGYDARISDFSALTGATCQFSGFVSRQSARGADSCAVYASIGGRTAEIWLTGAQGVGESAVGDWLSGSVQVLSARPSPRGYFTSGGVWLTGRVETFHRAAQAPKDVGAWRLLLRKTQMLRASVLEQMRAARADNPAAVVTGMLLSDSVDLRAEYNAAFAASGAAHYVTVSGFQLAVALGLLFGFAGQGGRARLPILLCGVALVLLCAAAAGFSPTVLRAAVMQLITLLGYALGRRRDALTALGAAGILLVCLSPGLAADAGFWFSFCAVAGIALFSHSLHGLLCDGCTALRGRVPPLLDRALFSVAVVMAAQLSILPVYACIYGVVAPWSLLANLLFYPLALLVLPLGALSATAFLCGLPAAGGLLLDAACLPSALFLRLSAAVQRLPYALLDTPTAPQWALALALPALFGAALFTPGGKHRRWLSAGGILCLALLVASGVWLREQTLLRSDPDSGCTVVTKGEYSIVLDGADDAYAASLTERFLDAAGARQVLAAVRPDNASLTWDLYFLRSHHPRLLCIARENVAAVQTLSPQDCTVAALSGETEIAGWARLSAPGPFMTMLSFGEINVLKLWAGYAIIQADDIPPQTDLIIAVDGKVYRCGGPRLFRNLSGKYGALLY